MWSAVLWSVNEASQASYRTLEVLMAQHFMYPNAQVTMMRGRRCSCRELGVIFVKSADMRSSDDVIRKSATRPGRRVGTQVVLVYRFTCSS